MPRGGPKDGPPACDKVSVTNCESQSATAYATVAPLAANAPQVKTQIWTADLVYSLGSVAYSRSRSTVTRCLFLEVPWSNYREAKLVGRLVAVVPGLALALSFGLPDPLRSLWAVRLSLLAPFLFLPDWLYTPVTREWLALFLHRVRGL